MAEATGEEGCVDLVAWVEAVYGEGLEAMWEGLVEMVALEGALEV